MVNKNNHNYTFCFLRAYLLRVVSILILSVPFNLPAKSNDNGNEIGNMYDISPLERVCLSRIDSIKNLIVIKGSMLDSALTKNSWHPMLPDMFMNYTIENADSIVDVCENLTCLLYGSREDVFANRNLKEIKPRPEEYLFLNIIHGLSYMDANGYAQMRFNPYMAIDWYRTNRTNITPLAYAYLDLFYSAFKDIAIDTKFDLGLRYNDISNRQYAIFNKQLNIVGLVMGCIERGATDEELTSRLRHEIYEVPFYDIHAALFDDDYYHE